jgi:hypothetical protein
MIQCIIKCMLLAFTLLFFTGGLWAAQPSLLADVHKIKGLKCSSCHKEEPPKDKVSNSICLECHGGQMKVIERTNKYEPNPHISPHSNKLVCEDCHHVHKPSEISCQVCHTNMEFKK